uniref:Uncharacterized protein n=1 Tax=Macaca fascicularis TaxID=9541 RepID=A0A7N9CR62_MACFA
CWRFSLHALCHQDNLQALTVCWFQSNRCRVHVHNVQVCYICILVPCWCAAPINSSSPIGSSQTSA